jgi:hypothetical protein
MRDIRICTALAAAILSCLAFAGAARCAESAFRFSAGIATIDAGTVDNPGGALGVDIELGVAAPVAVVLGLDFAQWRATGLSPFVTGTQNYHDFVGGLRLRWPKGRLRPYADVMLISSSGDFDANGPGFAAGGGLVWGEGHGPRWFLDGHAARSTNGDEEDNLVFARGGIALPFNVP